LRPVFLLNDVSHTKQSKNHNQLVHQDGDNNWRGGHLVQWRKLQMKTTLFAIAAMSLAGTAAAQSNVTLYGSIDEGVAYINSLKSSASSGSALRMDPGTMQPDRFGLRGSEDLGGGTQAIFQL